MRALMLLAGTYAATSRIKANKFNTMATARPQTGGSQSGIGVIRAC